MDTYMEIRAAGDNAQAALYAAQTAVCTLAEQLSVTDPQSEIAAVNRANGKPTALSEDTAALLRAGLHMGALTDGALNLAIYPLTRAWGFTTGSYAIPSNEMIAALRPLTDPANITLDGSTVTLADGMMLDTGAVAKGYAGDRAIEILRKYDISSAILSLGGNILTLGTKPDGSDWVVGITDPFAPDRELCSVHVRDRAVVTSGDYERYFIADDGTRYCHILDPATGAPAQNGLSSVTVIGAQGLLCDALSTALFVMGKDRAVRFWREKQSECACPFEMILVTSDDKLLCTEGIAEVLTITRDIPLEVIRRAEER